MDVAVAIPMFNGAKWIRQTLESVFSQEHRPSEVIVVDDGSEDESPDIVRAFSGATLLRHPDKGSNFARNFGLKHTSAQLVTFLDHDDIWHPAHLRLLSGILEQHPECPAVVASCCIFKSDNSLVFPPPRLDAVPFDPWISFPHNQIYTPSAVVMRRTALNAVGGWPTQLVGCGDVYTWLRLSTNQPLLWNRGATVGYRQHENSMSRVNRLQNVQRHFNVYIAMSDDALAYRLAVCPQDTDRLKRRLGALMPMSNILRAAINLESKLLKESALAFEESLAGESTAFIQSMLDMLVWFLAPSLCMETRKPKTEVLEILIEDWPKEAGNTRQALGRAKRNISISTFLEYLRTHPLQMSRWGLFADVFWLKLLCYWQQRGFFSIKNP